MMQILLIRRTLQILETYFMERIQLIDTTMTARPAASRRNDLLKSPLLRRFLSSRWYPAIFQWPSLIVFTLIIYQLMLGPRAAHDNLGTALTWVLWWPL